MNKVENQEVKLNNEELDVMITNLINNIDRLNKRVTQLELQITNKNSQ
ncbi:MULTISPECIES: hypothetical protein [Clostridium]|nr:MULTISPECIES: hypothetical protein [Clostridium]MCD2348478.1 hypothetical protein [Clostridium guangxiense]